MTEAVTNGELALLRAEVARLDQLRDKSEEASDKLLEERTQRLDQRIDGQETAVTTALLNAEKAVQAALQASERAVDKAETTQGKTDAKLGDLASLIAAQGAAVAELRSRIDVGSPSLVALQSQADVARGRSGKDKDNQALIFAVLGGLLGLGGLLVAMLR